MTDVNIQIIPDPLPADTIQFNELLLLNIESRLGKMVGALETANKLKVAGRNDITGLTEQITRLADAFEQIAAFVGCVTESIEGTDGVPRCYVRTRDDNHAFFLSSRDDSDD